MVAENFLFPCEIVAGLSDLTIALLILVSIWTIVWKGLALWKSARKNKTGWFVALLIINTLGILEILYIYVFSEMKPRVSADSKKVKKKRK